MKHSLKIEKNIFQVKFKPDLSFYDRLFKNEKLFGSFPHWQTDRLKISLRDFDKKHSLTIKHDSITYESDNYNKKNSDEIINSIHDNISNITCNDHINRLGQRFLCLIPVSLNFDELVKILNLKILNKDYIMVLDDVPKDSSITITSNNNGIDYRLQIGPMRNTEIPNYINFNIENHIDVNSEKKYHELSKLVENYPKTSLYIDLDFSVQSIDSRSTIVDFNNTSKQLFNEITKNLVEYIFEEKLK